MGFERCHPAVNFIYFTSVILGMIAFRHPIFLGISFLCAVAYSIRRNRWRGAIFDAVLVPAAVAYALYYGSYHHFGLTDLGTNFVGNHMTLESLVYGLVLGFVAAGVMVWLSCVYSVFTTDKVVYLFGRVSPRLSLFLAVLLRMVPRIKAEARRINKASQGIGRGAGQGNLFARARNCIAIFSMLISWTIGALATASESMRARGSVLRGRTAFSIYRFDNRDRAYVVALFACLTVTYMGYLLRQTRMVYDPRLLWTPITPMSWLFYASYAVFCLMPLGLELWTDWRFAQARKTGLKYSDRK